jgi:hypothetical protein
MRVRESLSVEQAYAHLLVDFYGERRSSLIPGD